MSPWLLFACGPIYYPVHPQSDLILETALLLKDQSFQLVLIGPHLSKTPLNAAPVITEMQCLIARSIGSIILQAT